MARRVVIAALLLCALSAAASLVRAADAPRQVEDRKSGYLFMAPGTRALQDDDFQNPGMFAIDRGRQLWGTAAGAENKSCASCHGEAETAMRGVAARYPAFDAERKALLNLELRINAERAARMKAPPFLYESQDMLALTAYLSQQSRDMPMTVAIDGPAQPFFEDGRRFYETRRGQLDLACNQCHDALVGRHLRGDLISQGQINGFPLWRVSWNSMLSRHRLFAWCNTSVRAEPYALGAQEYVNLELYLAWRGRGLPIETPAVRR
jgi:sulfur-oxidizing protein SoxA